MALAVAGFSQHVGNDHFFEWSALVGGSVTALGPAIHVSPPTCSSMHWAIDLLKPHLSDDKFFRYRYRLRCSPQPAMRAVKQEMAGYACYMYTDFDWAVQDVVSNKSLAVQWWLDDPWMPETDLG